MLDSKVVKIDTKIIISICLSKSVTHSVEIQKQIQVIPARRPQTTSPMGTPMARRVTTTSTEEPNGKRKDGIKMNMGTGIRYFSIVVTKII
jgi:hypothetical protein